MPPPDSSSSSRPSPCMSLMMSSAVTQPQRTVKCAACPYLCSLGCRSRYMYLVALRWVAKAHLLHAHRTAAAEASNEAANPPPSPLPLATAVATALCWAPQCIPARPPPLRTGLPEGVLESHLHIEELAAEESQPLRATVQRGVRRHFRRAPIIPPPPLPPLLANLRSLALAI